MKEPENKTEAASVSISGPEAAAPESRSAAAVCDTIPPTASEIDLSETEAVLSDIQIAGSEVKSPSSCEPESSTHESETVTDANDAGSGCVGAPQPVTASGGDREPSAECPLSCGDEKLEATTTEGAAVTGADSPPPTVTMTTNGGGPLTPPLAEQQPDHDTIKMFVGQIPRHMDEPELRTMFEEFGSVYQINVLRDKLSALSKGCCFVTFYTRKAALEAQNQLHNVRTLAGMHHPIQMKPADTENRNERKLFVGMVSKQCDESDVRALFTRFGPIEECTVLRDQNNHSKGCAFVTFSSRQNAIGAIKAMHQSQTMDGCSAPMVVKFADTQKDKDTKRIQSVASTLWSNGLASPFSPQYLSLLQQLSVPGLPSFGQFPAASQLLSHGTLQNGAPMMTPQQRFGVPAMANGGQPAAGGEASGATAANGSAQSGPLMASVPSSSASLPTLTSLTVQNGCLSQSSASSSLSGASSLPSAPAMDVLTAFSGLQHQFGGLTAAAFAQAHMAANNPAGKRIEGPEGCNLFIYHLPQELSDSDLAHTFMPFGNVISAKVFIDKQTNLSKCFGFVSYDNPTSSQTAIHAMNGFQIGTKRLKVQLKRSKEAPKPY